MLICFFYIRTSKVIVILYFRFSFYGFTGSYLFPDWFYYQVHSLHTECWDPILVSGKIDTLEVSLSIIPLKTHFSKELLLFLLWIGCDLMSTTRSMNTTRWMSKLGVSLGYFMFIYTFGSRCLQLIERLPMDRSVTVSVLNLCLRTWSQTCYVWQERVVKRVNKTSSRHEAS